MRKTVKIVSLILAVMMILATAAVFTACDGDKTNTTDTNTEANTPESNSGENNTDKGDESASTPISDGKVTYTVHVTDADGNAVKDVQVQVCEGSQCKIPQITDESGTVSFTFIPKGTEEIKVQINQVPEGFICDSTVYVAHFEEGQTEVTVVLEAASSDAE